MVMKTPARATAAKKAKAAAKAARRRDEAAELEPQPTKGAAVPSVIAAAKAAETPPAAE